MPYCGVHFDSTIKPWPQSLISIDHLSILLAVPPTRHGHAITPLSHGHASFSHGHASLEVCVGVGYHHPYIQWLKRPVDARQWGNPAAVAGQAVCLGVCPASPAQGALPISLVVQRQGATLHANSSSVVLACGSLQPDAFLEVPLQAARNPVGTARQTKLQRPRACPVGPLEALTLTAIRTYFVPGRRRPQ